MTNNRITLLLIVSALALLLLMVFFYLLVRTDTNKNSKKDLVAPITNESTLTLLPSPTFSDFVKSDFEFDNRYLYFKSSNPKTAVEINISEQGFLSQKIDGVEIFKFLRNEKEIVTSDCSDIKTINNMNIYYFSQTGGSKLRTGSLQNFLSFDKENSLSCDSFNHLNNTPVISYEKFLSMLNSGEFVPYFQGFPYNSEYQAGRYQTITLKDVSLEYLISGDYLKPFFNICGTGSFVGKTPEGKDFPVTEDICVALDAVNYEGLNEKMQSGEIKWERTSLDLYGYEK